MSDDSDSVDRVIESVAQIDDKSRTARRSLPSADVASHNGYSAFRRPPLHIRSCACPNLLRNAGRRISWEMRRLAQEHATTVRVAHATS